LSTNSVDMSVHVRRFSAWVLTRRRTHKFCTSATRMLPPNARPFPERPVWRTNSPSVFRRHQRLREAGPRCNVLPNASRTLGWRRMPLKIAAPSSINVCSRLGCAAGTALAGFARGVRGPAAGAALVTFAREPPAAIEPPFNAVESQDVSLLLTGRRRCFGSVACALMPTCFNVERGCCSRNLRAAANTAFFSSLVQKIRRLPGIDSPQLMLMV
jgi:hypothetical protein